MAFEKFDGLKSLQEGPAELVQPEKVENGKVVEPAVVNRGEKGPTLDELKKVAPTVAAHFEEDKSSTEGAFVRKGMGALDRQRVWAMQEFNPKNPAEAAQVIAQAENILRGSDFNLEPVAAGDKVGKLNIFSERPVWDPSTRKYKTSEFTINANLHYSSAIDADTLDNIACALGDPRTIVEFKDGDNSIHVKNESFELEFTITGIGGSMRNFEGEKSELPAGGIRGKLLQRLLGARGIVGLAELAGTSRIVDKTSEEKMRIEAKQDEAKKKVLEESFGLSLD